MKAFLLANQLYYPELENGSILFKTARIRASIVDYNPQRFRPAYHKEGMNLRSMGAGKEHHPVSESELSAIGLRSPEDANHTKHYQAFERIRNGFNTREDFLAHPPKKDYYHLFDGPNLSMTATRKFLRDYYIAGISGDGISENHNAPKHIHLIEFDRHGKVGAPTGEATPYREVGQMARAFHEFRNSPAGKVYMVAYPHDFDDLGEMRRKHYINNGFSPIPGGSGWLALDNRDPEQQ